MSSGGARNRSGEATFSEDDLARKFNVTARALRHYEFLGLVLPQRRGNMRIYSQDDYNRVAFIVRDRALAATYFEIGQLINTETGERTVPAFSEAREKCAGHIKALEAQRNDISIALADLRRVHTLLTLKTAGDSR